jgi:hypothetical protein
MHILALLSYIANLRFVKGIKICALNPKNNIDIKNLMFLTEIIKINKKFPVNLQITIKLTGISKYIEKYFG